MADCESGGNEDLSNPLYQGRGAGATNFGESKLSRADAAVLMLSHAQLVTSVVTGVLSYVDLIIIFCSEVIIIAAVTGFLHPRHDRKQATLLSGKQFVGMVVLASLLIGENAALLKGPAVTVFTQFHAHDFLIGFVYLIIRLGGIFWSAKCSANPGLAWGRGALVTKAVAHITLVVMLTFGFMLSGAALSLVPSSGMPDSLIGIPLSLIAIAIHFGYGVRASKLTDDEIMAFYGKAK